MAHRLSRVLAALLTACTSLLSGCSLLVTTEHGAPYTPDDVIGMLEETFADYGPHIVLRSSETEKPAPMQRNTYVLHDEANDFTFSCTAYVRHCTLPVPQPFAQRDADADHAYAAAYAIHLNPRIGKVAAQHGLYAATTEEAATLADSKVKRPAGANDEVSLFRVGDFIFADEDTKPEEMVNALREIHHLYAPKGNGVVPSALHGRDITFYYLPKAETDRTKAIELTFFTLWSDDWNGTLVNKLHHQGDKYDTAAMEKELTDNFSSMLHSARANARWKKVKKNA